MDINEWLNAGKLLDEKQAQLEQEMVEFEESKKLASKKTTPFEFIGSIQEKDYIFQDKNAKHYTPFVVTMGVSQFIENIAFAYEATKLQYNLSGLHVELANKMQYDYLFNTIRKGKKFGKWAKLEKYDNLELIQEVYEVSREAGILILDRLTEEEVEKIVEWDRNKAGGLQQPLKKPRKQRAKK